MRVTIETTGECTQIGHLPMTVWRGETENGIPVVAVIHTIGCSDGSMQRRYEQELVQHRTWIEQKYVFIEVRRESDGTNYGDSGAGI